MENVQILLTHVGAVVPEYKTIGAAGVDLVSVEEITIGPGERAKVRTGIKLAIPVGYEAQVRPRSGLALEFGVTVINSPGTIDADYRGEIMVLLHNTEDLPYRVFPGDRIGQLVFNKVEQVNFMIVTELTETDRGEGGFGHTGR